MLKQQATILFIFIYFSLLSFIYSQEVAVKYVYSEGVVVRDVYPGVIFRDVYPGVVVRDVNSQGVIVKDVYSRGVVVRDVYQQGVVVISAGKFRGELNGVKFENTISYGKVGNLFTIATEGENFNLTINWQGINSAEEIKREIKKLPTADNSLRVIYIDNKIGMPIIIKSILNITENNGKILKGTLEFTAYIKESLGKIGGTEIKLSNGSFEVDLAK